MPLPTGVRTPDDVVDPWPSCPVVDDPVRAGARVLLVSAHPDDETIGAGRLVAEHVGDVTAITLSAGEHCFDGVPVDDVARHRLGEWRTATAALGAQSLETQRWPDGTLARHEAAIGMALLGLLADVDVLLTTWRHDPHPDHAAAGRAAAWAARRTGVRLVEFPVWAPYWTTPAEVASVGYAMTSVATSDAAERARVDALAAYGSQTAPHRPGAEPVVPQALLLRHDVQLVARPR